MIEPSPSAMPRISIVTPSFNQGEYITDTIESVLAQDYPNLEHIVMDGGSTDETLEVLPRYQHLQVASETDRGQFDAINKGFEMATGHILGFLNSDDTLLPGALHRVAKEISPEMGRHVVMGRCRFTDEQGRYIGIEHPSRFESHARVLAIWKGYCIPQPAVFWTPEVWRSCGPMRDTYYLDYDLFCRFSRKYRFHQIDQVLATYRLQPHSKTSRFDEASRLEECIHLSQQYWGSRLRPLYWRMASSLALHRFGREQRAHALLVRACEDWRRQRWAASLARGLTGCLLGPDVAIDSLAFPLIRRGTQKADQRFPRALSRRHRTYVQTEAYLQHHDLWGDGWAGPHLMITRDLARQAASVVLEGWADLAHLGKALELTVLLNGCSVGKHVIDATGEFLVRFPLAKPAGPGECSIEVEASSWFVPHRFAGTGDFRPLSWQLRRLDVG